MATLAGQPNVGDGITVVGWSDRRAHTVVELIGTTAFIAQRDKATRTNRDEDSFSPGGFMGHTSHGPNGQQWSYEADQNGATIKVTRRKDGLWRPVGTSKHSSPVQYGRYEHYDYNF